MDSELYDATEPSSSEFDVEIEEEWRHRTSPEGHAVSTFIIRRERTKTC